MNANIEYAAAAAASITPRPVPPPHGGREPWTNTSNHDPYRRETDTAFPPPVRGKDRERGVTPEASEASA